MGLGKTVQVVCFLKSILQDGLNTGPALVVAPKSILLQWEKVHEEPFFLPLNYYLYSFHWILSRNCKYLNNVDIWMFTLVTNRNLVAGLRAWMWWCIKVIKNQENASRPMNFILLQSNHCLMFWLPVMKWCNWMPPFWESSNGLLLSVSTKNLLSCSASLFI